MPDNLSEQQKAIYAASAVFAPNAAFSAAALLAVWLGAPPTTDQLDALSPLIEALAPALLVKNAAGLLAHPSDAAHKKALDDLSTAQRAELQHHHLHHYRRQTEHWLVPQADPTQLDAEVAQFVHAVAWAAENAPDDLLGLVLAGAQNLKAYRHYRRQIHHWLDLALAALQQGGENWGQAGPIRALGDVGVRVHHLEAAEAFYFHALQRYGEHSLAGQAHTFKGLGDLFIQADQLETAQSHYYKALVLYEVVNFKLGQANTLKQLGVLYARGKQYDKAQDYYQRAIIFYDEMGFDLEYANSLKELGDLHAKRGNYEPAEKLYNDAYQRYGSIQFWVEQANTLLALGSMHMLKGDFPAAQRLCERALPILQDQGERVGQGHAYRTLGDLYLTQKEYQQAAAYFQKAAHFYQQSGAYSDAALVHQLLAHLHIDQENPRAAVEMIVAVLPSLAAMDDPLHLHEIQVRFKHIARDIGAGFHDLWAAVSDGSPLPEWLKAELGAPDRTSLSAALQTALESPQALHTAMQQDALALLTQLDRVSATKRAEWLEQAMQLCQSGTDEALRHWHCAILLKERASTPGKDVSNTLHAAVDAYHQALQHLDGRIAEYATAQKQCVQLLRDMAGMPGENRHDLLFAALADCDSGLEKLKDEPRYYAYIQLNRAHLLRELAGLRGESRSKWMHAALAAFDEVVALLPDAPLENATAQANRASLLIEIANLPDEDQQERQRQALHAALQALALSAQDGAQEYQRVAQNMLANIRQAIANDQGEAVLDAWQSALYEV